MIGKTRQYDAAAGPARGVLRTQPDMEGHFRHSRRSPAAELAPWIAHYWSVSWDLRGRPPHTAETVPHPNVHLVFDDRGATVNGVQSSKFTTVLQGKSSAFGVKFKPGGFRPFYGAPVADLANRSVDAVEVFGEPVSVLAQAVRSGRSEAARIRAVNGFFRTRRPAVDEAVACAGSLVGQILRDPTIHNVDALVMRSGMGKRSLQRLFKQYVGTSPKWVIRRYRLHEALERLHSGQAMNLTEFALELGYYDQAHLIQDFKSIVGLTPGQYQALVKRQPEP